MLQNILGVSVIDLKKYNHRLNILNLWYIIDSGPALEVGYLVLKLLFIFNTINRQYTCN